ncbi:MAG: TIGR03960 family B12-binding radical SAM protein [Clostridia bacterium]|nr:TIGR03960 family B12-binding radical SAM protein [Clostridia bacterium]
MDINYLLGRVEKPARYTGGEWGSVIKNPSDVNIRFAFCFPDTYEIGMSHLGMKILYGILNERKDTYCERVFAPWTDMEMLMRENNIPLFALETKDAVSRFDFVGFTLQYEMSYSNVINMLDLAKIPLLASDRGEGDPIVCGGGPCAYNAEPICDVFDFFMMGEGEEIINEVMDVYAENKRSGGKRKDFLEKIARIEGIYVPSFYDVEYNADGTVKSVTPNNKNAKPVVSKRVIRNMDSVYYPEKFIVPNIEIVHDRIMLEVFRGCTRGCRFCQAGMIYRPVREKSAKRLTELAKKMLEYTGYEEISLTSLSTSDYSELPCLCDNLLKMTENSNVNLSLPSLRIDNFSLELMEKIRHKGLTFAPEAGSQRLRDVINKNITEEDIKSSTSLAFSGGYNAVKLYFMMGLPTETDEDITGIADLASLVADQYFAVPKEIRTSGLRITVSTSCFVPKPFTPFQWEPMDSMENLERKQSLLKSKIRSRSIKYNWHDAQVSYLEAVFARGDRKLNKVLIEAQKRGMKFDGWAEHFNFEKWMQVFYDCGIDPDFYALRKREYDEVLPWDHINIGVSKAFMINENKKAHLEITTPQCREKCSGCGANRYGGDVCANYFKSDL